MNFGTRTVVYHSTNIKDFYLAMRSRAMIDNDTYQVKVKALLIKEKHNLRRQNQV